MRQQIRQLGAGLYGEVWLEYDPALNRNRAVKYVNSELIEDGTELFAEPRTLEELHHDNIVKVFEAGIDGTGRLYVVMEYMANGSLQDAIERGPIRLSTALNWAADVARAVQFAHENGFIHRDIKPSNVLLADDGSAKLSDFGLAARMSADGTAPALGYAAHLAPEAFRLQVTSISTDVFALGLTSYRLINGDAVLPSFESFEELLGLISNGRFPNRSIYRQDVPLRLRRVINSALRIDPATRISSALSFRHGIESVGLCCDWLQEKKSSTETLWITDASGIHYEVSLVEHGVRDFSVLARRGREDLRRMGSDCREHLDKSQAQRHLSRLLQRIAQTGK
jgi:serine/threonine-protein kinase